MGSITKKSPQAWSCICTYAPVCTQWTPAGPECWARPPSQHQQRPEEEERDKRRRAGRASDQSAASIRGRGPIRGRLGKWGKLAAGRAVLVWLVLATASGARKQPQVSPIGCPSTARRGDQPPHNHTASWTQSFSSPWQQPSLSSASSRQVSPVFLSSCHGVFWLRGPETLALSHNQVWLTAEDCGHTSECEGRGWGGGHYHMSLPWHQTMNN